MENSTKDLINELQKARSRFEILILVTQKQEELENSLLKKGLKFNPENHDFPKDITAGTYSGDTQIEGRLYSEINYIRRGLLSNSWDYVYEEKDRYQPIKEQVLKIWNSFSDNRIRFLSIENFKSVKELQIECKRINVFIGKPNVGKSNILEALGMFSSNYRQVGSKNRFFDEYIRYKDLSNLFYDNNTKNPIKVKNDLGIAHFSYLETINHYAFFMVHDESIIEKSLEGQSVNEIENNFRSLITTLNEQSNIAIKPLYNYVQNNGNVPIQVANLNYISVFKKYEFNKPDNINNPFHHFLLPPDGNNLASILLQNPNLFEDAAHLFEEYKLDLVLKEFQLELEIQKKIGRRVYPIPYYLVADTLQRMIFYFAAIRSNHDSILIFEEPEAHAFPPYTDMIAEEMIKATSNQFFISTHSPYLLNKLIEHCPESDLSIFKCSYKDYNTEATALTQNEIKEMSKYGIDIFYQI